MHKQGTLNASNTVYEKWRCMKCWTEVSRAVSVNGMK
jgi:hypothetical protein